MAHTRETRARDCNNMQLIAKQTQRKNASKEVIATAQDIKYARFLAGNDKTIRDRAIKSLRKWFEQRSRSQIPFKDEDLMLVWKGLFYSMWMSDKPLIQEECAERIAALIHSLDTIAGFQFFKAGLKTLANEWFGIDQWRSDKFLMFVRRLLRQALILLKTKSWDLKLIKHFALTLEESILNLDMNPPYSLLMHFCDIFMPELAKVTEGALNANILNEFLLPFVKTLAKSSDMRIVNAIIEQVFRYLMKQSNVAMDFEEKFEAWKSLGFPGGNINAMQKTSHEEEDDDDDDDDDDNEEDLEEDDDEEDSQDQDDDDSDEIDDEDEAEEEEEELTGLDPRAGNVNTVLPQVNFSCKNIISLLTEYRFKASNTRVRSTIQKLVQEFSDLAGGDYPLGIKKVDLYKDDGSTNITKSAKKLVEFENKLYGRNKENKVKKRKNEAIDDEEADQEVPVFKKQKLQPAEKVQKKAKKDLKTKKEGAKETKKLNAKLKTNNEKMIIDELIDKQKKLKEVKRGQLAQRKLLLQKLQRLQQEQQERKSALEQAQAQNENAQLFVRNSGTWFVTEPDSESDYEIDSPRKPLEAVSNGVASPKSSPKRQVAEATPLKTVKSTTATATVNKSAKKEQNTPLSTKKSPPKTSATSTPVKTSTPAPKAPSPPSAQSKKLFETSDWDADLQDGEVELFVPSKKYLAKRNSLGAAPASSDLVQKSFSMIKAKNRRKSADAKTLLNAYARASGTPRSNKKVKIDLRLNQSQEVHEHHEQIRCSPGIPFDASRKPNRPVIKANALPSPINPFYNKRRVGLKF